MTGEDTLELAYEMTYAETIKAPPAVGHPPAAAGQLASSTSDPQRRAAERFPAAQTKCGQIPTPGDAPGHVTISRVDGRLFEAVENNARWCDLVCRSHGIPTQISRTAWAARRRAPQLYPDAVSLLPDAPAEEVLQAVETGLGCSVKDSFASMDLERFGFDELFEAHWIYREPPRISERSHVSWTVVENEDEFAEWVHVAGLEQAIGTDLLHDSTVRFLSAHGPDDVGAGAIASRTGSVVGVSNVFSPMIDIDETWATLADAFARAFPSLALVGYEHGESLEAALASGFTAVGPLRVWLRTSGDEGLLNPSP